MVKLTSFNVKLFDRINSVTVKALPSKLDNKKASYRLLQQDDFLCVNIKCILLLVSFWNTRVSYNNVVA